MTTVVLAVVLAVTVVAFAAAFISDLRTWRNKSRDELLAHALGSDWRYWKACMRELKRRGEDVSRCVPHIASHLLSEYQFLREAAQRALSDVFPEIRAALRECGYRPADPAGESRAKLAALFVQHSGAYAGA